MVDLLSSSETIDDVKARLSRGPGGFDRLTRSFRVAASYGVACPGEAAVVEYARSENRLDWALQPFDPEDPRRNAVGIGDDETHDLRELIVRVSGAGTRETRAAGVSLVKDFQTVLGESTPTPGAVESYQRWTRRLLPVVSQRGCDVSCVLEELRSKPARGEGADPEGSATLLLQYGQGPSPRGTLWVLMGPAEYSLAVPLWPETFGGKQETPGPLPEALTGILEEHSIALQAAKLARRGTVRRLIDAHLNPVQSQMIRCVGERLVPFWGQEGWNPTQRRDVMPAQMVRVQRQYAEDALSLLRSFTRLGAVGNTPPEAKIETCKLDGLRVSLTGRIDDAQDGAKVDYLWDYGDGVTGKLGRHTYPKAGRYLVRLTVTDRNGVSRSDFWPVVAEGYPPVRKGDRPVDALRRHRRVRPGRVVIAGSSQAQAAPSRAPDVPMVCLLAVTILLGMGALSAWRIRRLRRKSRPGTAGPSLRLG
jgi:hypothetical protein